MKGSKGKNELSYNSTKLKKLRR
jgi:hypothetical protein